MEQLLILSRAGDDLRRRIERSAKVVQEGSEKFVYNPAYELLA